MALEARSEPPATTCASPLSYMIPEPPPPVPHVLAAVDHVAISQETLESTLLKCQPGTGLVAFLKKLCTTAARLHCIVDRNMRIDSYITHEITPAPLASLLDLLPATATINVQTDAGYVTISRDWPSHRMETVDSLVDEIAAAPGITHIALPASEGQEP